MLQVSGAGPCLENQRCGEERILQTVGTAITTAQRYRVVLPIGQITIGRCESREEICGLLRKAVA